MFLDIGGSPLDFWDYTVSEIGDLIASFNRVYIQKKKERVVDQYRLSQMIVNQVSLLLSKDATILDFWEYAPELFEEERRLEKQKRKEQELVLHKERMRLFAERFNMNRKEKADEYDS